MLHAKSLGLQKEGQWGASIVHDDTEPAAREGKLWVNTRDHKHQFDYNASLNGRNITYCTMLRMPE